MIMQIESKDPIPPIIGLTNYLPLLKLIIRGINGRENEWYKSKHHVVGH